MALLDGELRERDPAVELEQPPHQGVFGILVIRQDGERDDRQEQPIGGQAHEEPHPAGPGSLEARAPGGRVEALERPAFRGQYGFEVFVSERHFSVVTADATRVKTAAMRSSWSRGSSGS